MSSGAVAVIVAAISLAGTGLAAYLSARAQRTSAKVQEKASVFEGYDELVAHLRARIVELETRETANEATCRKCERELRELREDHAALKLVVGLLRRELELPDDWDPLDYVARKGFRYGRRFDDVVIPETDVEIRQAEEDHEPDPEDPDP